MRHRSTTVSVPPGQRGLTVIEMVITLAIMVIVLVGALQIFDLAASISRVQLDVADMQQSLRSGQYDMVRMLRMAGRGSVPVQAVQPAPPAGAPFWSVPNGIAVSVRNNVPANETMDDPATDWKILPNTDVLTIRGVFTSPVCTVVKDTFTVETTVGSPDYGEGSLRVINQALPFVPVPQSLKKLANAIRNNVKEALIMVSAEDDSIFQIVELVPQDSVVDDFNDPTNITVAFRFDGGDNTAAYLDFSGGTWNARLKEPAYIGIMEEYRYYVLDERENPADPTSPAKPRLVRAQMYPGTQAPYRGDDANWGVAIADNVADLQIALGIQNGGASPFDLDDNVPTPKDDEWLYNHPTDVRPDGTPEDPDKWRFGRLFYARVNTTVFSDRRDVQYAAPQNVTTEDHVYVVPEMATPNAVTPDRTYRRRNLTTVVDLRNL